jgi:hypothetical protein
MHLSTLSGISRDQGRVRPQCLEVPTNGAGISNHVIAVNQNGHLTLT